MTALADIRGAIDRTLRLIAHEAGGQISAEGLRFVRQSKLRVDVGDAAARGIVAETDGAALPARIDEVPVRRTRDFDGFDVVIL